MFNGFLSVTFMLAGTPLYRGVPVPPVSGSMTAFAQGPIGMNESLSGLPLLALSGTTTVPCAVVTSMFVPSFAPSFSMSLLFSSQYAVCLLYTSDAADEEDSVDLGG